MNSEVTSILYVWKNCLFSLSISSMKLFYAIFPMNINSKSVQRRNKLKIPDFKTVCAFQTSSFVETIPAKLLVE